MANRIGIVGAGPAGCTLAYLLHINGYEVQLFDTGNRPQLLVGESLIPSVIPVLRKLGIEDQVASAGVLKPGAVIYLKDGFEWRLPFDGLSNAECSYAYNINRNVLDSIFLELVARSGISIQKERVKVHYEEPADCVVLTTAANKKVECDFFIDCSGRRRLFSNELDIDFIEGPRKDTALFAHLDTAEIPYPGCIHLNVFSHGWTWRIPLGDVVSVGVVACNEYYETFGSTREEQYDAILAGNEVIRQHVRNSRRLTQVKKYDNYQLRSKRVFGTNWALAGDAAGFIDPAFSSGLHVALYSANTLAELIISKGPGYDTLLSYSNMLGNELSLWESVVNSFYEGGFFSIIRMAEDSEFRAKFSKPESEINSVIARAMTGFAGTNPNNHAVFKMIIGFCEKISSKPLDAILSCSAPDRCEL